MDWDAHPYMKTPLVPQDSNTPAHVHGLPEAGPAMDELAKQIYTDMGETEECGDGEGDEESE